MKWTENPPKEMGYYWAKVDGFKQVVLVDEKLRVFCFGKSYLLTVYEVPLWSDKSISEKPEPWKL